MIPAQELAFVRLAMRKRLLKAHEVREAVERKKWDAPARSLPSILMDMGVLDREQAVALRDELSGGGGGGEKRRGHRPRSTMVARDPNAYDPDEDDDEDPEDRVPEFLGPYRLEKLLGAGAMGAVYKAHHQELRRDVALKLLLTEGAPTPRAIQRFKREARLAARLDHPNVVRVHEAGQDQGFHYIAMDMVKGRSVAELIITEGEMSPRRAIHLMRRVAEAVGYAHEQDVIHRDLKPANILVDEASGEARVTDFGLAVLAEGGEDDRLTRTGAAVGTPAYMAPEQVRGQLDKIDRRTDVYALGATFYEMLTGSPPFEASTFLELAKRICDAEPVAPRRRNPAVSADVETICLKALEKKPELRYQSAFEMAEDLGAFLDDREIVAQRPSVWVRLGRWARRHPALMAGLLGFVAVGLSALGVYLSLPGTLEVSSQPLGAEVMVNGEAVGTTHADGPLRLELSAGPHELLFVKEGYLPRAMEGDVVSLGHGETLRMTGTLVSTRGLLQVVTQPSGAEVIVENAAGERVAAGSTPYLVDLLAGRYVVRTRKPGYLTPGPHTAIVSSGGAKALVEQPLAADPAGVELQADPANVTLTDVEEAATFAAPHTFRGAGAHSLRAFKAGYLARSLSLEVPPATALRRRVSLAPLLAYRRPLEGRWLGRPLACDVDADGARDLVVLERGEGVHLALLRGGGGAAAYRVRLQGSTDPDTARAVGAGDLNADGILDLVAGDAHHLEVRDGRDGSLLAALPLDARVVRVAPERRRSLLIYLDTQGQLAQVPLDAGGLAAELRRHDPKARRPPLLLRAEAGGFSGGSASLAACPLLGEVLFWRLSERRPTRTVRVPGVTPESLLIPARLKRGGSEVLVVVPPRGSAQVVSPGGKHFAVGERTARFLSAASVVVESGAWLFLGEATRSRAFRLSAGAAREVPIAGLGPGPLALEFRGEPVLWTAGGESFVPRGASWERDPERSTERELWGGLESDPLVVDLDRDGLDEVLAPGLDRRSLVALVPDARWLRWRLPRRAPDAAAPARLRRQGQDLLLAWDELLVGVSGRDGAELFRRELPGPIQAIAASGPEGGARSAIYVAYTDARRTPGLARIVWEVDAWKESWTVERAVHGLTAISLDVDNDGLDDLLVDGPLALVRAADGREMWRAGSGLPPALRSVGPPRLLDGQPSLCVAAARERSGAYVLTGSPLEGGSHWSQPLAWRGPGPRRGERGAIPQDAPLAVLSDPELSHILVVTRRGARGLTRADGKVAWQRELEDAVGAALLGGPEARLVVSQERAGLVALDPRSGRPLWLRPLPPGPRAPSPPLPLPRREGTPPALALVAPSGAILLLDAGQGRTLGERRSPSGAFLPWLELLPGGLDAEGELPPALCAASSDERLLCLPLDALSEETPSRRAQVVEQLRHVALGEPYLGRALEELKVLANQDPTDPTGMLALARGYMASGLPDEALATIRPLLGDEPPPPAALRLLIEATYDTHEAFEAVEDLLARLADLDGRLAADVAVELSERNEDSAGEFLALAIELDPGHAPARRRMGLHILRMPVAREFLPVNAVAALKLRTLAGIWKAIPQNELLRARSDVSDARLELTHSLDLADHDLARAAAIVAGVLERQLILELKPSGARRRLRQLERSLGALAAGGPAPDETSPLLRYARKLARARGTVEQGKLVERIYPLRRDWVVPLAGIRALGS